MSDNKASKDPTGGVNPSPWWKRRWGVALVLFVILVVISWLIANDDDVEGTAGPHAAAVTAEATESGHAVG